jgi:hypothetical protein
VASPNDHVLCAEGLHRLATFYKRCISSTMHPITVLIANNPHLEASGFAGMGKLSFWRQTYGNEAENGCSYCHVLRVQALKPTRMTSNSFSRLGVDTYRYLLGNLAGSQGYFVACGCVDIVFPRLLSHSQYLDACMETPSMELHDGRSEIGNSALSVTVPILSRWVLPSLPWLSKRSYWSIPSTCRPDS